MSNPTDQDPEKPQVIVYTGDRCNFCIRAKNLLEQHGIDFHEINVDRDPEIRQWLHNRTGLRTIPQIFIHQKPVGGYQELVEICASGKILSLMKKES